jgi:predicted DNA-binding transcriptional regulator AlpA
MRFLSMKEVCTMFGVTPTTIARWEEDSDFPRRTYLGRVEPIRLRDGRTKRSNCRIGFMDDEVIAWASARPRKR